MPNFVKSVDWFLIRNTRADRQTDIDAVQTAHKPALPPEMCGQFAQPTGRPSV